MALPRPVVHTLWALFAATALPGCGQPTAERIAARSAEALLGPGGSDDLQTLRVTTVYPDHEYPVITEIRRPNLMRVEGVGRYVLVFDGRRAAFLEQEPAPDGTPRGPELVDPAYVRDFELDLAWIVPAYLDHPSEYLGTAEIDGVAVHQLRVVLPLGIEMVYSLDADTYLPLKATAEVTIDTVTYHPERVYGDYVETGGITYARTFRYSWMPGEVETATVESVERNPALGEERFTIPAEIG